MKSNLKLDPSFFWRYVNSKKSTDNQPKSMYFKETRTANELEQVNLFADFFGSNYDASLQNDTVLTANIEQNGGEQPMFELDPEFVLKELTTINPKKGAGLDGIHPLILRNCASQLFDPFTEIFIESLSADVFSTSWKRSSVSPVFRC